MKIIPVVLLIMILSIYFLGAHEGHQSIGAIDLDHAASPVFTSESSMSKWMHWLGNFHPVVLHFPIALTMMTVVAELLYLWLKHPLFDYAARFMIIAAAIMAIPTVLFGLAWSYQSHYVGDFATIFWWHRFFGLTSLGLALIAAFLREIYVTRGEARKWYYICLAALFISINIGAFLGGELTFGLNHMALPW